MAINRTVRMVALLSGVHSLIERDPRTGAGQRITVVTNADGKADAANMRSDPRAISAYQLSVSEDVAADLDRRGIAQRVDKGAPSPAASPTVVETAAGKLGASLQADGEGGEGISGADTRDTTAFRRNPLTAQPVAAPAADGTEADDADAPPVDGGEGEGDDAAAADQAAPSPQATAKPKRAAKPRRAARRS